MGVLELLTKEMLGGQMHRPPRVVPDLPGTNWKRMVVCRYSSLQGDEVSKGEKSSVRDPPPPGCICNKKLKGVDIGKSTR